MFKKHYALLLILIVTYTNVIAKKAHSTNVKSISQLKENSTIQAKLLENFPLLKHSLKLNLNTTLNVQKKLINSKLDYALFEAKVLNEWIPEQKMVYEYNEDEKVSRFQYSWDENYGSWMLNWESIIINENNEEIIQISENLGDSFEATERKINTYSVDPNSTINLLQTTVEQLYSEGEWVNKTKTDFYYDDFNKLESSIEYEFENNLWEKSTRTELLEVNGDVVEIEYVPVADSWLPVHRITYKSTSINELVTIISESLDLIELWGISSFASLMPELSEEYYDGENWQIIAKQSKINQYDEQTGKLLKSKIISETFEGEEPETMSTIDVSYNSNLQPESATLYVMDEEGDMIKFSTDYFTYNSTGNVNEINRTFDFGNGFFVNLRVSVFYNDLTSIDNLNNADLIPNEISLLKAFPNPFNPTTKISFELKNTAFVKIDVFDVTGKSIANISNEMKSAGKHNFELNANNLSSGKYFVRIHANNSVQTINITLIK